MLKLLCGGLLLVSLAFAPVALAATVVPVWPSASELTLPAGANTTAGDQNAHLESVTCTSAGNCVAVGSYKDTNGSNDYQAMVVTSVASLAVATSSLASGVVGSAYSAQLASTGGAGADTWSVSSGSLPAGLSLNASTGVISGVPTAAGASSFTLSVSNPGPPTQQASASLSIAISAPPLAVATSSLASGVVGSAYSAGLASSGGAGGDTWSVSSGVLPAGLSLNASTGVISGVPTAVGASSFTLSVSNPGPPVQQAAATFSIAISAPPRGRPGIGVVKIKGLEVTVTLSCGGTVSQTCTGTLTLSALEHLTGHKLTAVSAAKKPTKPKKTTRTVTLAKTTYRITGGGHTTVTIKLDATGKQLLAKYHKLPAKLAVTPSASNAATATKTVTFTPSKAKPKHH